MDEVIRGVWVVRRYIDQVICTQKGRTNIMQDEMIIELYFRRDERALIETSDKYGLYCRTIARSILRDEGNVEECFNDTLFCSWRTIPPTRPNCFKLFLAKITRNLSLKRIEKDYAAKRGGGEAAASIDELSECMSDKSEEETDRIVEDMVIREVLERFLTEMPKKNRRLFVRRYWYCSSIKEIAVAFDMSEANVATSLSRIRGKLKDALEKAGIVL